jgi:hypothetical protein
LFEINGLTPKFNLPTQEQDKTADKPAIKNNIAHCNGSMKKGMVVHYPSSGING